MRPPVTSSTTSSASLLIVDVAASRKGRTPGKGHKSIKSAVRRSHLSPAIKSPFEKRKELEKRREAVRGVEKEMKEEKAAELER